MKQTRVRWFLWLLGAALGLVSCASSDKGQSAAGDSQPAQAESPFVAELQQAKDAARRSLLKDILDFSTLADLHYAAGWGTVPLSRYILQRYGELDIRDSGQRTPLFLAVGFNAPAMLEYLLAQGADPEAANFAGTRPVHMAAGFNGDVKVLEQLLAAGVRVNVANQLGSTPLHWAAGSAALAHTKMLLAQGAQLNVKDNLGRTALDVARQPPARVEPAAQAAEILLLQSASSSDSP